MSNNLPNKKDYLSISKAAKYLGVSTDTIRRWDAKGKISAVRFNGQTRYFSKEKLSGFKQEQPLSISEAAEKLSVSISTLRRFDGSGLIKAQRDPKGNRVYSVQAITEFLESKKRGKKALRPEIVTLPPVTPKNHAEEDVNRSAGQNLQTEEQWSPKPEAEQKEAISPYENSLWWGAVSASTEKPKVIPVHRFIPVKDFLSSVSEKTAPVGFRITQTELVKKILSISNTHNSTSKDVKNHSFIPDYKRAVVSLGVIILLSLGLFSFTVMKDLSGSSKDSRAFLSALSPEEKRLAVLTQQQRTGVGQSVLAEATGSGLFTINLRTLFNQDVQLSNKNLDIGTGRLTASNIVYSLSSGSGVSVTGGQNPTISNSGVLSIGNASGTIQLGTGLSISGNTLSGVPSFQDEFSTIKAGGSSFSAGSSSDTLEFLAGSGIGLSTDTGNKKITISSTAPAVVSDWTLNGNNLYPNSTSYSVGIGNTSPTATLDVTGTFQVSGATTFNGQAYTWPSSGGSPGYVLMTDGGGGLSWASSGGVSTNYFAITGGSIYPINSTIDFLIGGASSSSAKFAVKNVNSGTPVASLSGSLGGAYLTANGLLATTVNQNLTIGAAGTGNITLSPMGGSGSTTFQGGVTFSSLSSNSGTTLCVDGSNNLVTCAAGFSAATLQSAYANGNSITTTNSKNIDFALSDTASDSRFRVLLDPGTTGYMEVSRIDGAATADPAQMLIIDNQNTTRTQPVGLKIQSSAAMTTAIDLSDPEIVNALSLGGNTITGNGFLITAPSSGMTLNATGSNLSFQTTTSGDITATTGAAAGLFNILTGNLKVGNGTPVLGLNGNNAYITGSFEVGGATRLEGAVTLPSVSAASGSILCVDASNNIVTCSGTAVTSVNSLSGAITIANATAVGNTITLQDASTTQKGIAQFNSSNFTASSGTINTIQNISSSATPTFSSITLSGFATAGVVHNAAGGSLSSSALNLAGGVTEITGTLPKGNGGTGTTSFSTNGVLYDNGTVSLQSVTGSGYQVLQVNNVTGAPFFGGIALDQSAAVSGTLQVNHGGTGNISFIDKGVLYGSGSAALAVTTAGLTGQVLAVNAQGIPEFESIAGGGLCATCVLTNPNATQTIIPTGDITGLIIRQTATASPSSDIFNVANNGGSTKYFQVDSNGNIIFNNISQGVAKINGSHQLITGTVDLATSAAEVTGVLDETHGGTNQSSYVKGDILYASGPNTLAKLGVGADGKFLSLSSGLPSWQSVSLACSNCIFSDPAVAQTITPTADVTGLSIAAASGSPVSDIFSVTNNGGGTAYLKIDSAGNIRVGGPAILSSSLTVSLFGLGVLQSDGSGHISSTSLNLGTGPVTGTLGVSNGGTGSNSTSGARSSLGAAASGANSDITSLSGLTTPLSVPQGGTGVNTLTLNGVLFGNGSSAVQVTASGSANQVLTSVNGVPAWANISSSSCTDCVFTDPIASQIITPTGDNTGLAIRQTATGTPTADIFSVADSSGATKYLQVNNVGDIYFKNIAQGVAQINASGKLIVGNITLGSQTSGDYVADVTAGNGLTGSGSGVGSTPTLSVVAGNGISVGTDVAIKLDTTSTGSAVLSSTSGMELSSNGLSLLRGCSPNQILKWNAGSYTWACSSDLQGSGTLTGSGTLGRLPKFEGTSTNLADSNVYDDGTYVGIGTITPQNRLHLAFDDTTTNSVINVLRVDRTTSNTAGAGIGAGLTFGVENGSGTVVQAADLQAILTGVTAGSENGNLAFRVMNGGVLTEQMRLLSNGDLNIINGGLQLGGTSYIGSSGNLTNIGTTQFNGITYTWPSSQTANYVLQTNGSGTLSWVSPAGGGFGTNYFSLNSGAIYPTNTSLDLLIGASSTASAKFAFMNVNTGVPTASLSAGINGGMYITADGILSTTANQTLTLGGGTTGNIILAPFNSVSGAQVLPGADNTISLGATGSARFKDLYLGPSSLHLQCSVGDSCGQTLDYALAIATSGIAKNNLLIGPNGNSSLILAQNGNIGIGNTNPNAILDITGGYGSNALLTINQLNSGDLISASSSGTTRFRVTNSGGLVLDSAATTSFGGISYTWPNSQGADYVLQTDGSGNLSWTSATGGSIGTNYFTISSGSIYPTNSTLDFLLGGNATSSARFGLLNVNSGAPTASLSAGAAGGLYLTANGTFSTTAAQDLTIGGNMNGNILFKPGTSAASMYLASSGRVGIDNSNPAGLLDISGPLSLTPSTTGAYLSISGSTLTDNGTAASGVVTNAVFNSIGAPTLAASNAGVSTDQAYSLYLAGVPTAGSNQTILNSYALGINGKAQLANTLELSGTSDAATTIGTRVEGKWTLGANSFNYRRTITVTNNDASNTIPTNYEVTLSLSGANASDLCTNTRADNDDLRISTSTPTEIARNISKTCNTSVSISFKTQATIAPLGTATYYIYYGNFALASAGSTYSYSNLQLDNADNVAQWTSSDGANYTLSQETTIKQEGTGSVKIVSSAATAGGIVSWSNQANAPGAQLDWGKFLIVNAGGTNYAYHIGGSNNSGSVFGFSYMSTIDGSGNLGTWTTTASLTSCTDKYGAATVNISGTNYIYVVGGHGLSSGGVSCSAGNNTYYNTVYKGTVNNSTGAITWTTGSQNALVNTTQNLATVIVNVAGTNYIYAIGGDSGGAAQTWVYRAQIDASGNVGAWSSAGQTQLPVGWNNGVAVTANVGGTNYIYTMGGSASSGTSTVFKGTIDSSGNVTSWDSASQSQISSGTRVYLTGNVFTNGGTSYLYAIGGGNFTNSTATVSKSTLDGSGNVGTWGTSGVAALGTAREALGSDIALVGSTYYIYASNGYQMVGGSSTNKILVERAQLTTVPARTATKTIASTDLSSYNAITFKVYSSITGTYANFHTGQSSPSEFSQSFTVNQANTWETKSVDISALTRTGITQLQFEATNTATGYTMYFDDIEAVPSYYPGSAPSLASAAKTLGLSNLNLNAQGTGVVNLNYDTTNSLAGTGGLNLYNGGNTSLFSIDSSGNAIFTGTTKLNNIVYSWPSSQIANGMLTTNGSGTLTWASPLNSGYFTSSGGLLYPVNNTLDFAIGATASTSADFAVLNVNSGTPVASLSAGAAGGMYMTAAGAFAATAFQNMTIGSATTGDITLAPGVSTDTNTNGHKFIVTGSNGNGSGAGGVISVTAGQAGLTGTGGAISLTTGAGGGTSGNSGVLLLQTGNTTSGSSGNISLVTGTATGVNTSGIVSISTGAAASGRNTGAISIVSGAPVGTGTSGAISLGSGNGGVSSGAVSITSGTSGSSTTGAVYIGSGTGTTNSGSLTLASGDTAGSTTGTVTLKSGTSAAGKSGDISIITGGSTSTNVSGTISIGSNSQPANPAAGSIVQIYGQPGGVASGAGLAGGAISLTTGAGSAAATSTNSGGNGGAFVLAGGAGGASTSTSGSNAGTGSLFQILAGAGGNANGAAGTGAGAGGTISIVAGAGGTTGASGTGASGGSVSLTGGAGSGAAAGGAFIFTAGQGGATGTGGDISLTTGAGGGTSGNSGALVLDTGAVTSGTAGAISIGASAVAKTINLGNATGATALNFTSGTGAQTFTSSANNTTTSSSYVFNNSTVTSGTLAYLTSSSLTTGKLLDITSGTSWTGSNTQGLVTISSSSTNGQNGNQSYLLYLSRSGANTQTGHSAYGIYSNVTNTNVTSGTNVAGYFSASGATTANYGVVVPSGFVGIGTATPTFTLQVNTQTAAAVNDGIKINGSNNDMGVFYTNTGTGGLNYFIDSTNNSSGWGGGRLTMGLFATSPILTLYNGFAGIGNLTPSTKLSVNDTISAAGGAVATITNTNTTDSANTVTLRLNTGATSTTTNARFVTFYSDVTSGDTGGTAAGHINLNNAAVNYGTSGADFGERMYVPGGSEPGDIIGNVNGVNTKADSSSSSIVGVVSDTTGFTGNDKEEIDKTINPVIGMLGQVKVKVNTSHGVIHAGDYVGLSSTPGIGSKSVKAGLVLGQALEDFTASDPVQSGRILVYVNRFSSLGSAFGVSLGNVYAPDGSVNSAYQDQVLNTQQVDQLVSEKLSQFQNGIEISATNSAKVKVAASAASTGWTMTLPTDAGQNGQIMTTDGNGNTAWVDPSIVTASLRKEIFNILGSATDTPDQPTIFGRLSKIQDQDIVGINDKLSVLSVITDPVTLVKSAAFNVKATFTQGVEVFQDLVLFGRIQHKDQDSAGFALIKAGSSEVEITFDRPYATLPVINITPQGNNTVAYVKSQTLNGFVIGVSSSASADLRYSWNVTSVESPKQFESSPGVQLSPATPTP